MMNRYFRIARDVCVASYPLSHVELTSIGQNLKKKLPNHWSWQIFLPEGQEANGCLDAIRQVTACASWFTPRSTIGTEHIRWRLAIASNDETTIKTCLRETYFLYLMCKRFYGQYYKNIITTTQCDLFQLCLFTAQQYV